MAAAPGSLRELDRSEPEPPGPLADFWHHFRRNRGALVGLAVLAVLVLVALLADVLAPHPPDLQYRDFLLLPPAFQEGGRITFLLGTDALGRDIFSRILHGARYSLAIGVLVILLALVAGIGVGLVAAFAGGVVDTLVMRLMDVLIAMPGLLLALVVVALVGPGLFNAMFAIAVVYLPHFVRLTRAAAMVELGRDYVTASRMAGAGVLRLMFVTVLPNCAPPLIVQATLGFSTAVLDMAALGFLGMGAQPPTPEWGTMLADAREFILRAWWVVTMPGLAILVTVLAINLVGDGLRDVLDPRLRMT